MRKTSLVPCLLWCLGVPVLLSLTYLFLHGDFLDAEPTTPVEQPIRSSSQTTNPDQTQAAGREELADAAIESPPGFQAPSDVPFAEETEGHRLGAYSLGMLFLPLFAVIVYALIIYQQLRLMADALKQHEEQIHLFRQQIQVANRAWVMAEMVSAGPVSFDDVGARINFAIRTRNTGGSPALNLRMSYKVVNSPTPKVLVIQKELAQSYPSMPEEIPWGAALFPGCESVLPIQVTVDKSELNKEFPSYPKGSLWLHVIGCVDYGIGSSPEHHQTFFYYPILRKDGPLMNGEDVASDHLQFAGSAVTGSGAN